MVAEKEIFLRSVARFIDFLTIIFSFVIAYFLDEYIRQIIQLTDKAYGGTLTFVGLIDFSQKNLWMLFIFPLMWLILLTMLGLYEDFRTKTFGNLAITIVKSSLLAGITAGSVVFILQAGLTSRLFIAVFTITTAVILLGEKKLFLVFLDFIHLRGYNQINLLIVGTGKRAQEFIKAVKNHANWGLRIVGLIDDEHGMYGKEIDGFRVLGRLQDIPFIIHRKVIDRVIFVVPRLWLHRIDEALLACEKEGISTAISLDLYDLNFARTRQTDFSGFPLLEFETFSAHQWELFIKRTIDIIFSIVLLILFGPLIILTAIAVKATSSGPVFFKQTRCGLNGRKFTLYKFRSMVVGAEMKKFELEKMNEMDGPVFKIRKDPRITPLGRILRRTSIDELPQLFNVLKGDMSIVGPRPPLPVEVEMYEVWHRRRLSLKPGITCIWQVSGRNKISFERWMEMDLEYIDNWSLWGDFKILVRTVFVVLFGYGAV
jgi:exopolysaccharide biosynthesis polyprenyl glycosylphosphotransferase